MSRCFPSCFLIMHLFLLICCVCPADTMRSFVSTRCCLFVPSIVARMWVHMSDSSCRCDVRTLCCVRRSGVSGRVRGCGADAGRRGGSGSGKCHRSLSPPLLPNSSFFSFLFPPFTHYFFFFFILFYLPPSFSNALYIYFPFLFFQFFLLSFLSVLRAGASPALRGGGGRTAAVKSK